VHNSSKEQKNADPKHILNIRDKEIENAKRQIEMNDKEIQRLSQKIEELSGVEKIIALEQNLHEAKEIKSTLEKEIKQLEKQNGEQGKKLDKLTNDVEYHSKIRNLVEELRIWKEKVKRIEDTVKKEKLTRKIQVEVLTKTEEENK